MKEWCSLILQKGKVFGLFVISILAKFREKVKKISEWIEFLFVDDIKQAQMKNLHNVTQKHQTPIVKEAEGKPQTSFFEKFQTSFYSVLDLVMEHFWQTYDKCNEWFQKKKEGWYIHLETQQRKRDEWHKERQQSLLQKSRWELIAHDDDYLKGHWLTEEGEEEQLLKVINVFRFSEKDLYYLVQKSDSNYYLLQQEWYPLYLNPRYQTETGEHFHVVLSFLNEKQQDIIKNLTDYLIRMNRWVKTDKNIG